MLRSSGLYQMRGSTPTSAARAAARRAGRDASREHRVDVAEHRRRRVGVVAVDDDLHLGRLAAARGRCAKSAGITSTARAVPRSISADASARPTVAADHVEVGGPDERRRSSARLSAEPIAILDGQRDVPDVEVERVAVQEQEERRDEEQDEQRPAVAPDLPQLLDGDGPDRAHAALPRSSAVDDVEEDVLERRHDPRRSLVTVEPARRRAARRCRPGVSRGRAAPRAPPCRRGSSSRPPASRRAAP